MAATNAMSGMEFWQNTELGRALAKRLPPETTRVIIDISIGAPVKIYYASVDTGPIVDLKWDQVIEQFEVVEPCKLKEPIPPSIYTNIKGYSKAENSKD